MRLKVEEEALHEFLIKQVTRVMPVSVRVAFGSSRSISPSLPNSTCFWIRRHISLTRWSKVDAGYF